MPSIEMSQSERNEAGAKAPTANSASDEAVATQTEQRTQDDYPVGERIDRLIAVHIKHTALPKAHDGTPKPTPEPVVAAIGTKWQDRIADRGGQQVLAGR